MMSALQRFAVPILLVIVAGCSRSALQREGYGRECLEDLAAIDHAVADAGVRDAQAAVVRGFPYLRVNRFLASYRHVRMDHAALEQWAGRMQALDREGRLLELANLPPRAQEALQQRLPAGQSMQQLLRRCEQRLWRADAARPEVLRRLRKRAVVADEYRTGWRVAGLYSLTSVFVNAGTHRLHKKTRKVFALALDRLVVRGRLIRYLPPAAPPLTAAEVGRLLIQAARNPLRIPQPAGDTLERLFASFAPVWEVDTVSGADRIGHPVRNQQKIPRVETDRAVVYRQLSHTRYAGQVLVQLNYVIWFPRRPRGGPFDLLGGHMDGITWRVTLAMDGRPLLYDSIHNCGCYQMSFPMPGLRLRRDVSGHYDEPPLVPQQAPVLSQGQRLVIRVAAGTHYLQHLYGAQPGTGVPYALRSYSLLRSLPRPDGTKRSLFGRHGIVAGTRRRERWLLWTMGVPAPGAMRQWGHHAITFVGRRHMDDADVIARYFEPVAQAGQ